MTIGCRGRSVSRLRWVFHLLLAMGVGCCLTAQQEGPATFTIRNEVKVSSPPSFGVNIIPPIMTHWNTEPWNNDWWADSFDVASEI